MNMEIIEFPLEANRAFGYIKECLTLRKTLSTLVLPDVRIEAGEFFTFLTENYRASMIYYFDSSTITERGLIADALLKFTENYLKTDNSNLVLFESANEKRSDNIIRKENFFTFNDDVVYYIDSPGNPKVISTLIRESISGWANVILFSSLKNGVIREGDGIDEVITNELIKNVKIVCVGAYDLDGYVFYKK
jgi:hypothetical protein